MAILLDLSQIGYSTLYKVNNVLDDGLLKHSIINSIRMYNKQFGPLYGEMIICVDGKGNWRKKYFKYYKADRSEGREKSTIDFELYFSIIDGIVKDLINCFPFVTLKFNDIEADDIISVLAKKIQECEPVVIVSSDKDFYQLHKYSSIKQFSPSLKKEMKMCRDESIEYLKLHIINGDAVDGIPNIFTRSDWYINGHSKSRCTKKLKDHFLKHIDDNLNLNDDVFLDTKLFKYYTDSYIEKEEKKLINENDLDIIEKINNDILKFKDFKIGFNPDNIKARFEENKTLICSEYIPNYVSDTILTGYDDYKSNNNLSELMLYFGKNNMKLLLDAIEDFKRYNYTKNINF